MIITVTMNPAIDKTVEVDKFQPYALNRIRRIEYDVGGKGINVSKTIHALGGESLAMGFLGGNTGMTIENVLNARNIRHDFIYVDGDTRTNTKIFDCVGGVTELNEPGPAITEKQTEALIQKICTYTDNETLVVLAGSVPGGVRKTIYAEMTECVHKKGGKVLLDADGELFRLALKAVPDSYREASFGLGAGKLRTIFTIVLPSAVPGILAGIILAIGRIIGETAALLYTSGTVAQVPNLMGSGRTLALHMYVLSSEGLHMNQASATAVVILLFVLLINGLSGMVAKRIAKG